MVQRKRLVVVMEGSTVLHNKYDSSFEFSLDSRGARDLMTMMAHHRAPH
jgi:hypothetical protein